MLLGIDIGTSGTKTLLCDAKGHILATASVSHPLLTPKPGWSEQDPQAWWKSVCASVKKVMRQAGADRKAVKGIGLSGQMHGSVFLGRDTTPLRPALLWNDQRTAAQCAEITEKAGGTVALIEMVGNPALTGFTAPKILWLARHEPRTYAKVRHILLPKDYIRLCMTGVYRSEVSDASGTLLLDVRKRQWNTRWMEMLKLDPAFFPECVESHEITGELTRDAARAMGLHAGIPVVGGAGDQAAGAVGNGIVTTGIVSASLGTSGVVFAHADEPTYDPQGRVHTMCSAVAGKWCVFGCMLSAAGSLEWYREKLGADLAKEADARKRDVYDHLLGMAAKAPMGSEGLFFLPYLTGERCPYPDPNARGGWIGLTRRHDRAMMIRALVEGVTFGMADQIRIMQHMAIPIRTVRLSGGGARSAFWRQLQADIYGQRCATINSDQGPALGAAILAGVGTGLWPDVPRACKAVIRETKTLKPDRRRKVFYGKAHQQYTRLYHALADEFDRIEALGA